MGRMMMRRKGRKMEKVLSERRRVIQLSLSRFSRA